MNSNEFKKLTIWGTISGLLLILVGLLATIGGLILGIIGAVPGLTILFIGVFHIIIAVKAKKNNHVEILKSIKFIFQTYIVSILSFVGVVFYSIYYIQEKIKTALESLGFSYEETMEAVFALIKEFL